MPRTEVKSHRRKGTAGVKRHSRTTPGRKKVPHQRYTSENLFETDQDVYKAVQQALDGMGDMTADDQVRFSKEIIEQTTGYLSKEDHVKLIVHLQQAVDEWPK